MYPSNVNLAFVLSLVSWRITTCGFTTSILNLKLINLFFIEFTLADISLNSLFVFLSYFLCILFFTCNSFAGEYCSPITFVDFPEISLVVVVVFVVVDVVVVSVVFVAFDVVVAAVAVVVAVVVEVCTLLVLRCCFGLIVLELVPVDVVPLGLFGLPLGLFGLFVGCRACLFLVFVVVFPIVAVAVGGGGVVVFFLVCWCVNLDIFFDMVDLFVVFVVFVVFVAVVPIVAFGAVLVVAVVVDVEFVGVVVAAAGNIAVAFAVVVAFVVVVVSFGM